ncbi:DUF6247 family protein, partial [Actinomadura adrarensis]
QAIAQVCPAALPAFNRALDQAADQARLGSDLAPLRRFTRQWAIHVHIQRQPHLAARFAELEERAQNGTADEARAAASELGRILDEAQATLDEGMNP